MDNSLKPKSRVKKKYPCPNPLFEKWLKEWKDSALEKGLKSRFIFSKALTSLRKYPLPLSSGKEAKILENFGDKICSMLDERLCEWRNSEENSTSHSITLDSKLSSSSSGESSKSVSEKSVSEKISSRIIKNTAIIKRDFSAVQKVHTIQIPAEEENVHVFHHDSFCLYPGNFDVILCVDNCETLSGHGKTKKQVISELQKNNVQFDVRKLNVGDFLWIARENTGEQRELVLDFIVERKRIDDLWHSIKDGRFREQKFRLRNCGVKHPVYLVEYHCSAKSLGVPEATLQQAIVNTQIVDNFLVKQTRDIKESVAYLSLMTKYLRNMYQGQILRSGSREAVQQSTCPNNTFMNFTEFNYTSVKNKCLTVKEMFAKHLLQFFGLSVDKAASIVEKFPTPFKLFEAYSNCSSDAERVQLLSNLRFGKSQKIIGQGVGKSVKMFYCTEDALKN